MNKNKLKAVMYEHGDNGGTLSKFLGIARSTLSNKMNEMGAEFTQSEIRKICDRYNLTPEQTSSIFFA